MTKRVFIVIHTKGSTETTYLVSESSHIRAIEAVLDLLYTFTSKDTVRDFRARYGFEITAEPWNIEEPMKLYSRTVEDRR